MKKNLVKFSMLAAAFLVLISLSVDSFAQTRRNQNRSTNRSSTNISNYDINDGLKAALFQGVENAVDVLGRRNGFLDNVRVEFRFRTRSRKPKKPCVFSDKATKLTNLSNQ